MVFSSSVTEEQLEAGWKTFKVKIKNITLNESKDDLFKAGLQITVIFIINLSANSLLDKTVKNAHNNLLKSEETFLNDFFYPTNSPNPITIKQKKMKI